MLVAVAPVGDPPGGETVELLVPLAALSLVLVVVIISRRRNRDEGSMSPDDRAEVERTRNVHKSLAKYYLWVAAVGVVLLAMGRYS